MSANYRALRKRSSATKGTEKEESKYVRDKLISVKSKLKRLPRFSTSCSSSSQCIQESFIISETILSIDRLGANAPLRLHMNVHTSV